MPIVGEVISEVFETGIVGESFALVRSLLDGAPFAWNPQIVEQGNGFYAYTYQADRPGFYSWAGEASASGAISINFEVNPVAEEPVVPPPPPVVIGPYGRYSLDGLIEEVALRSMDLVQAVATEDAGDLTSFIDANALIEDNAFFAGMEIHLTSGTNAGQTRRVANSYYDNGQLVWAVPLAVPVVAGDSANLYNRSGLGHLYREYKNAINQVIRELGPNAMRRVDLELLTLPTSTAPSVELDPALIAKVCRFSYQTALGRVSLRRNKRNGWWADNGATAVTFTGNGLGAVSNSSPPLIAHGYQRAAELVNGDDRTFIDSEWLVETAAGLLQNANPDNAGNLAPGQYLRNRADAMRGKMATSFDANCVSVA